MTVCPRDKNGIPVLMDMFIFLDLESKEHIIIHSDTFPLAHLKTQTLGLAVEYVGVVHKSYIRDLTPEEQEAYEIGAALWAKTGKK